MDDPGLQPFQLIINATSNVAFAAIVGAFSALALLAGSESAWARSRKDAIKGVLGAALAIGVGAGILRLWILAALISELPLLESLGSVDKILLQAHAGRAWAVGITALVVVLIVRPRKGRQQNGTVLAVGGACAVLFAASTSWASHAGATGDLFAFAVDWAHLVSVSVWAGMVGISATVVLRGPVPHYFREKSECAGFVQALSDMATASLAVVVLTGAFSSWRSLGGSMTALVSSSYGGILLVKLALVAVAAGLGARNRFAAMPSLLASLRARNSTFSVPYRKFVRTLSTESRVLLVVLALAAALSTSSPPT